MIFVDTGAWFAAVIPTDPDHGAAASWLVANIFPLLTTDYVIDETLTLLRRRRERTRALLLGAKFLQTDLAEVHKVTEAQIILAWKVFRTFADKDWSFTDCTSKIVIEQLRIDQAFSFEWSL